MKSWKYKFLEKTILGQDTNIHNSEMVILKCINRAYRDMLTAGRYYINSDNEICEKFKEILESYNYKFSHQLILDAANLFASTEIIGNQNKYVTRFGLSQKLVNMTYKYFFIFDDYINKSINYKDCDCPLDSIILKKLNSNIVWSKCTENQYNDCQNKIRAYLEKINLDEELILIGNLAYDFLMW